MGIKYKVNSDFFKTWNPTMAYVLGFIYADGCIYQSARGNYLVVTSTDREIIVNLKRWMDSDHVIVQEARHQANRKAIFILKIGDKKIYEDLLKLGVHPSKSLTIRMPEIPASVLCDFARGCFDGDGCAFLWRSKGITQERIVRKMTAIFTSGSRLFLEELLKEMRGTMLLQQTKVYVSRRAFQLRFNTGDSIAVFKFMYRNTPSELFFLRKFNVFRDYFVLRPAKVDEEIRMILQYVGSGHVAK